MQWSQCSSDLVKTICKRRSASPGQRGWPRTSPRGQDEVLCSCEGLEMGISDIPRHPQWDQRGILFPDIRASYKGAGEQTVCPGSLPDSRA